MILTIKKIKKCFKEEKKENLMKKENTITLRKHTEVFQDKAALCLLFVLKWIYEKQMN